MEVEPTNVLSGFQHPNHKATVVVKFLVPKKAYVRKTSWPRSKTVY